MEQADKAFATDPSMHLELAPAPYKKMPVRAKIALASSTD
jgi:hypothetical protein